MTMMTMMTCAMAFQSSAPTLRQGAGLGARRRVVTFETSEKQDLAAQFAAQAKALREEAAKIEEGMEKDRMAMLDKELDDFFESADANGDGQVTLDELRDALRSKLVDEASSTRSATRARDMLASEERLLSILKDLDANADGVLQREEFVTVSSFRERLQKEYKSEKESVAKERRQIQLKNETQFRLQQFETIANSTSVPSRFVAALAYLLPALDALPYSIPPPSSPVTDAAVAPLVSAAIAFRALPFSGILAFLALSSIAGNFARPRLERFAARHAIVMDISCVLALPLLAAIAPPSVSPVAASAFEALVLVSAVAAFAGVNAGFVPLTGQLTTKFTEEGETAIKNIIESATTADFSVFLVGLNATSTKDDNAHHDDNSSSSPTQEK